MRRAGIALGSNLGAKVTSLKTARDFFSGINIQGNLFLQSRLYSTAPVGCPEGSEDYVNAVLEFTWPGTAEELLLHCQDIEQKLGRVRSHVRNEPRTADVDIIYLGDLLIATPSLTIPHPRVHCRKFVLCPLADIRPDLILPGQVLTVVDLLNNLDTDEPAPIPMQDAW